MRDGRHFSHSTADSTRFAFELFSRYGESVTDLEIRRSSLEDTYLSLVDRAESGRAAAHTLEDGAR